jgi:mycothiol system anti-sigma-R factor
MSMSFFERLRRLLGGEGDHHPHSREGEEECATCRPISCVEALERVHEYLDGEMDEASAADVAHHFNVCQGCYPHLRLEERFRETLRKSGARDECPEHLRLQVMELLAAESREGG